MRPARDLPVPATDLHQLIQQALMDLKSARRAGNATGTARAERRMNALLDQLAKMESPEPGRIRTGMPRTLARAPGFSPRGGDHLAQHR